jgi:hypothetical protein
MTNNEEMTEIKSKVQSKSGSNPRRSNNFSLRKRGVRICPEDKSSGFEFESLCEQLETASHALPQKKLDRLRTIIVKALKKRFKISKEPKYGGEQIWDKISHIVVIYVKR